MELTALQPVVDEARLEVNVHLQNDVLKSCLTRILRIHNVNDNSTPREEQIRVLRRLIYNKSDTVLIARTGFGKSLIFHAFSILTGKITLQLIPLTKLGDEQADEIRKLEGATPCVINSESKQLHKDLLARVARCEFTHVLIGPEQASSKQFRDILKDMSFQNKIGLVAIDECHLLESWGKSFRQSFAVFGELRLILRQDIVWFGCSATLDSIATKTVLSSGGFRPVGDGVYETEVIRTSIDRPDIAVMVAPIPRQKLSTFETLYWLLDDCMAPNSTTHTPQNIPKTIVFVDSRQQVFEAAAYLRDVLLSKTKTSTSARYGSRRLAIIPAHDVSNIIQVYTSQVAIRDRDYRYDEFKKPGTPGSLIRIMIATTSLGMGMNISDIERVVLWKFPIDLSLSDYWQRLGRGGRGPGCTSQGFIFLPYWMFDTEGISKPRKTNCGRETQQSSPVDLHSPRRFRHQLPSDRSALRSSQLTQITNLDDESDAESVVSIASTLSQALSLDISSSLPFWTATDEDRRRRIPKEWMTMVNSPCHRRTFLEVLGEDLLPFITELTPASQCCSRCNRSQFPTLTVDPSISVKSRKPRTGTRAAVALFLLEQWSSDMARELYQLPGRRFHVPADAFLDQDCQWQLCRLYDKNCFIVWQSFTLDQLYKQIPELQGWEYKESSGPQLLSFLANLSPQVDLQYLKLQQERRDRKERKQTNSKTLSQLPRVSAEEYSQVVRRKDDSLATQVARREAFRAVHPTVLPEPMQEPPAVAILLRNEVVTPITQVPSTPLQRQRTRKPLTPRTPVISVAVESLQKRKREPLAPIQRNLLTFSPTSRSGRKRILTERGSGSFEEVKEKNIQLDLQSLDG